MKASTTYHTPGMVFRYPPVRLERGKREEEFKKLWPKMEKLCKGSDTALFKKFAHIVYSSFTENFLQGRGPGQHYSQLRYFFDFFMQDFSPDKMGDTDTPGAVVKVESPQEESLPSTDKKAGISGIMIHAADSPFIFENLVGYIDLAGHHTLSGIHPVITVKREKGKITDLKFAEEEGPKEVFLNFHIKKVKNPKTIAKLETEIHAIIKALHLSIHDFKKMTEATENFCGELEKDKVTPDDARETSEFLKWLSPNNYIFMGMTHYKLDKKGKKYGLKETTGSRLGISRDIRLMKTVYPGLAQEIEKRIINTLERPYMLAIDFFSRSPSIIYSHEPVDIILVRQYGDDGVPKAITVWIGRFARGAIMSRSTNIPFLRMKLDRVIAAEKLLPNSHMHREITTAFNKLPKRELFYTDRKTLATVLKISALFNSDYELHILARENRQFEYLAVILIFSVKKYSQEKINKIKDYFSAALNMEILYCEALPSQTVAQIFIYFHMPQGDDRVDIDLDIEKASRDIRELIISWDELLVEQLVAAYGDQKAYTLYNLYKKRITDLYKEAVKPKEASGDLLKLEEVEKSDKLQLDITCNSPTTATLRIYWNKELDLMKLIPTFRNLGLRVKEEIALPLTGGAESPLYVQLLLLEDTEERIVILEKSKERLMEAIQLIIGGETEDSRLNSLLLMGDFDWRQIDLVRGYKNYLQQINKSINPISATSTIIKYPGLVAVFLDYFQEKFDPKKGNKSRLKEIKSAYEKGLGKITDLTEDSVMRQLFDIAENTLRTNYYKRGDDHYISFKLNCAGIAQMPKPVPMTEIYVHSPFIEGVHLRGGRVARGGLRWSDRPDDFRTEILGLMKTQMVKNAVIVPSGSKGGFVIKKMKYRELTDRNEIYKHHYQSFIKGLLDLTDNLIDGEAVSPEDVVCYDEHDPYLVVAADKGTATMSDSANEVSNDYQFWLGDAFASGGGIGYDHKKFGITARGTWECIKRHFRELGVDIQKESITVAGVGDMSGDVFGNGMLLSEKIKLVAAFNHKHIFLDPDPDPAVSFKERNRLFTTPGTQWSDYGEEIISDGGGIFLRTAKSIPLSKGMQKLLGVQRTNMSGRDVIRAILTMRVDLLYFGGIGTYLRSSGETDLDVGDKANDSVRVTADMVLARVIGEGANLAMTQKARIEYAQNGGINNMDAIDNAGGVNMSDHEVNIKILLEILLRKKEIKDGKERNAFFTKVGPEVAERVLKDNYLQSAGITMDQERSAAKMEVFCDYIDEMESRGIFSKSEEDIPDREMLLEFSKKPGYMPRPILAVVFGYEKIRLDHELLASKMVDYSFSERYLFGYFPLVIQRDFASSLDLHRLKREIISTVICNKIVNQAGASFVYATETATGCPPWEICKAYIIVENLLQADEFRNMVHELDNKADAKRQIDLLIQLENLIARVVVWMLKHMESDRISFDFINQYQGLIKRFMENLHENLESMCSLEKGHVDVEIKKLEEENIPERLGKWIVMLPYLKDIMSIINIKEREHSDFIETGNLFIQITSDMDIDWILSSLETVAAHTPWEKRTVENLLHELEQHQHRIVMNILEFRRKGEKMAAAFRNYMLEKEPEMKRYKDTIAKVKEQKSGDILALGVLVRMLSDFD